ncbi:MAG: alkaline phosphatase [Deltaproteobacteria bacterium]|nr:alkaline phosphatase [Deltaproteobacteria bacterium]
MDPDQELLSRLLTAPAADAWGTMFGRAWAAFADADPEKHGRNTLVERERALDPIELALEAAAWDLWADYEGAAERTSDALAAWWSGRPAQRAVLILDGLSLREAPWLLRGAAARGLTVHQARATGAELPGDTTSFARALGFGQRSALENDGLRSRATRLPGARTESGDLPWADARQDVDATPDQVLWHHWPDERIHALAGYGDAANRLFTEASAALTSPDFWDLVHRLATGRRLVITSDHGYAVSGEFPDAPEAQAEQLKAAFKGERSKVAAEGDSDGPWLPPIQRTFRSQHGLHRCVLGRRKWKSQGGYPKLTHGGLTLLEMAVPFIELSLPGGV